MDLPIRLFLHGVYPVSAVEVQDTAYCLTDTIKGLAYHISPSLKQMTSLYRSLGTELYMSPDPEMIFHRWRTDAGQR